MKTNKNENKKTFLDSLSKYCEFVQNRLKFMEECDITCFLQISSPPERFEIINVSFVHFYFLHLNFSLSFT